MKEEDRERLPEALYNQPVRQVDLSCGCKAHVSGKWWQPDEYVCKHHGRVWITRVSRGNDDGLGGPQ